MRVASTGSSLEEIDTFSKSLRGDVVAVGFQC